jgi:hypothetical protein
MKKKTKVRNIALALFLTLVFVPEAGPERYITKKRANSMLTLFCTRGRNRTGTPERTGF